MATLITKNSSTASSVPTAAQLVQGELAVNVTDKRLFTENSSGTVVELGTNPSTLALPNGTANGVTYLNGSKVLTTGSALTFDGTNFASTGNITAGTTSSGANLVAYASTYNANGMVRLFGTDGLNKVEFGASSATTAFLTTRAGVSMIFGANDAEQMRLTSTGLGIGTSSPTTQFVVSNAGALGIEITGSNGSIQAFNRSTSAYGTMNLFANTLYFRTGVSPALNMALDSSGNLGIGTSSPSSKLEVLNGGDSIVTITGNTASGNFAGVDFKRNTGTVNASIRSESVGANDAGEIIFQTRPNAGSLTTQMRLTSSGNLGLGVTPSANGSGFYRAFELGKAGCGLFAATASLTSSELTYLAGNAVLTYSAGPLWSYGNNGNAATYGIEDGSHKWYTAPSGTAGNAISFTQAMTLDASGNLQLGGTTQYGSARLTLTASGAYMSLNSTTVGYSLVRGFDNGTERWAIGQIGFGGADGMAFYTGTANTERARITSGGDLLVGTTSSTSNVRLRVDGGAIHGNAPTSISTGTYQLADNGSSPNTLRVYNNTDSNNTTNRFLICDAGASVLRAEIRSNGGLANYSANNVNLSDRREKTNFAPAKDYLDTICAIPVQTFNYIDQSEDDPGLTLGVVAQDVQAVAPELVMESNWGTEDNPKMRLSIYQTDLQYALMKALQELKAEFDAYKATHP